MFLSRLNPNYTGAWVRSFTTCLYSVYESLVVEKSALFFLEKRAPYFFGFDLIGYLLSISKGSIGSILSSLFLENFPCSYTIFWTVFLIFEGLASAFYSHLIFLKLDRNSCLKLTGSDKKKNFSFIFFKISKALEF